MYPPLHRKWIQNTKQGIYEDIQPGASEVSFPVSGYQYIQYHTGIKR